jgi:uncharacterized alkaline shock family protein YloU
MVMQQLQTRDKPDRMDTNGREVEAVEGSVTVRPGAVAKVAGMTVREMEGVSLSSMGGLMSYLVGAAPGAAADIRRAVKAGVSDNSMATVDLWMKVDYGNDIPEVVSELRRRITDRIRHTTGLETKRINVEVTDIVLPIEPASTP